MTITTQARKITESKPFYALTGAGDYAVEKARAYATTMQGKAEIMARELPEKAKGYADAAATRFARLYDDLADRGRKVVSRVSGEAALELTEVSKSAEPEIAAETTAKRTSRTRTTTQG
ncbi:hypothetical protein GCM10010116_11240 [Microbispora rosea subsp. aerata]|nr:hypothetical protein [Microbispora rosea]GGO05736.1 hypothetical protein GCM10010116_11240 [Microbispora rosea subsp. aerata]GIH55267.1 hypothetical protein Mro02_21810 [Microbispora rosea subsp. aerata]GLJ82718.1 hypothetical protein GCM10017588_14430 [Microbispora rosea subsp. aerata]